MDTSNYGLHGTSSKFHPNSAREINVLLVEHDSDDSNKTVNMLENFSYRVTSVQFASVALSVLAKEKTKFDVVIVNINSCHSYLFHLLQETVKMNSLVILMCEEDNMDTTMWALEHGAFLCVKKPISIEMIGYLWQHVIRSKMGKIQEKGQVVESSVDPRNEFINESSAGEGFINVGNGNEYHHSTSHNSENGQRDDEMFMRRKVWTEWTQELHEKFMDAIIQLGEGRCYPKEILELMNVPGLTRMQVASHLQKCRNAKWIPPNKRKSKLTSMDKMSHLKHKTPRSKTVRFGSMPRVECESEFQFGVQEYMENHHNFTMGNGPSSVQPNDNTGDINAASFGNMWYPQITSPIGYPNNETLNNVAPLEQYNYGLDETLTSFDVPYGNETLNMAPLEQYDSSANSTNYIQRDNLVTDDTFQYPYMAQNLPSTSQLEPGIDCNWNFPPLFPNQVQYDEVPLETTYGNENYWSPNIIVGD